jgi:hypothetical protein
LVLADLLHDLIRFLILFFPHHLSQFLLVRSHLFKDILRVVGKINFRQLLPFDKLKSICDLGCLVDHFIRGVFTTIEDVLTDGVVEKLRLLHHQPHPLSQLPQVVVPDIDAIDQELSVGDIVEPHNKAYQGAFPCPTLTNHSQALVVADLKVETLEDPVIFLRGVPEPDVFKLDFSREGLLVYFD